ncbi:3-beta hydroxysteroid dehydrogenase [Actinocatenispora thailandica]|uniref:3-beta hydroxysteroid dehydrogenase n=1 Tax=Actinocatenispora thailandica TaxID=227318 RepID=A0A7R7DLA9_9ACTN|nr:NAD(P)H-binding protein [Actinocatenispora thailandica]BCJ33671.1 3-beta hydroxysteroid dehydrogenase [Actinocatenispora thailandica]
MDRNARVLVAGATGYLGRNIAVALHDAGFRVRALARDPRRLDPIRPACDEVFVGAATRPETLAGLCDDVDVVVSSVGLRTLRGKPTPEQVDLGANLNILARAREAGVGRFLFVSVLHAAELAERVPILRPREEFTHRLVDSGLTWTVLRPTGAFNDMAEIFRLAARGAGMVFGDGRYRINPVHPRDIGDLVAESIRDSALVDQEFGFGGPDTYTAAEIVELAQRVLGRRRRPWHLPYWPVEALSAALRPINRNASGFLRFFCESLGRDMVGTPIGQRHLVDYFAALAAGTDTGSR